ncbi:DPH4 homolog [Vespa mandarinia]|uniref:DPH4 homolog n=1 Tax=Vespa mandarinia TaxID=7446 RepID=UPI00160B0DB6|nr:DPH4 homolog [Vespa mandarinia]
MDIYDYYNTLGCSMESSYEEIRHAYYHRARQLHPDKTIGTKENTKEFQLLAEAWSILKDPDLRKKYDTECKQAELESNNIIVHATVHLHELQETNKKDVLSFPCRCGNYYKIDKEMLEEKNSSIYVTCEECTFIIIVKT